MFASNRSGGRIALMAGLILATASIGAAQDKDWDGPAALAIEVRGDDGKPVEGATITLRVADRTPPVGPPAVVTDDHGRALISHLGELEWYVEVSHESFMLYAAYIKVKADKKPVTGFSSQVNTATSWTPMRIKFAKAKSDFSRQLTKKERRAERQIADLEHHAPEARQPVPSPLPPAPEGTGQAPQSPPPTTEASTAPTIDARQPAPDEELAASPSSSTPPATIAADVDLQAEKESEAEQQAAAEAAEQEAAERAAAEDAAAEQAAARAAAAKERSEKAAAQEAAVEAAAEAAAEQAAADAAAKEAADRAAAEARAADQAVAREAAAKASAERAAAEKAAAEAAAEDAAAEQRAAAEAAEVEAAERAASEAEAAAKARAERIAAEEAATKAAQEAAAAKQRAATEAAELEAAERAAAEAEAAARASVEKVAAEPTTAPPPSTPPSQPTPTPAAPTTSPTTASAPRPIPSYMASADLGTCAGCQPGEWSMIDQETVANARTNRTDTCPADPDAVLAGIRQLVESVDPSFTGTISAALTPSRYAPVPREARAAIRQQLGAYLQATSTCRLVGVLLPSDSSFAGYQYEAWSAAGGGACVAGMDCAVGRARWNNEPTFVEGPVTAVFALFHNRSERYDRRAKFTVYFVPPSPDWTP